MDEEVRKLIQQIAATGRENRLLMQQLRESLSQLREMMQLAQELPQPDRHVTATGPSNRGKP